MKYHRETCRLLDIAPGISSENVAEIQRREAAIGISIPESLKEWYGIENSVQILQQYSNCDVLVPLERIGEPVEHWYGASHRDFVQQGLLWISRESQGVANWAVELDGTQDPPVLVEVDSAPNEIWELHARTFSDFVLSRVWDFTPAIAGVAANDVSLGDAVVVALQLRYKQAVETFGWPGNRQLRFENELGRILIWQGPDGADLHLRAGNAESLGHLVRDVLAVTGVKIDFYPVTQVGESVLCELQKRTQ